MSRTVGAPCASIPLASGFRSGTLRSRAPALRRPAPNRRPGRGALLLAFLAGCGSATERHAPTATATTIVELVETAPVETDLDRDDVPDTAAVWLEMIDGARESIEFEHFYASNAEGSRLEEVVRALERAADRGVRVAFTADQGFYDRNYPETLDRLGARENVEVHLLDLRPLTGGIQHAKCMLVDGRDLYVGSANFDWRALEHIQELGLRVRSEVVGGWVGEVLELDRALAGGAALAPGRESGARPSVRARFADGATFTLSPAFSPRGALPDESTWDLPGIVERLADAESSIRLQLLSYAPFDREGAWWPRLDDALRDAATRGVRVRMIVAHWSDEAGSIEPLAALAALHGCEVVFLRVPRHSSGEIPFARVAHAKLLVVDEDTAWIGTSNWQRGYFSKSRNLGFFLDGAAPARRIARWFDANWESPLADPVAPAAGAERPVRRR